MRIQHRPEIIESAPISYAREIDGVFFQRLLVLKRGYFFLSRRRLTISGFRITQCGEYRTPIIGKRLFRPRFAGIDFGIDPAKIE